MSIDPTNPGRAPGSEQSRLEKLTRGIPARPDERTARTQRSAPGVGDAIEISAAARELHNGKAPDAVVGSSIPPDRLRVILDRLASGHYESPDVREAVALSLSVYLRSLPSQQG